MKMKKLTALLLAGLMMISVSACAKQQETPAQTETNSAGEESASTQEEEVAIDTFIVGTTSEITSGNRSEYGFDVLSGTLSQLAPVYVDGSNQYHPLLCDYQTENSKTWKFTVRDGMKWHDGTPVTAEDILFTLEYLDVINEGGYASTYADIRVIDDKNIELELEAANPRFLSNLTTLRIMPKHIYEGIEDYTTVENEKANIGCGPYQFVRFDADAGVIEFQAFDEYPDGKPAAETVLVQLFDNEDTMYMALKNQEIDMIWKYSGGVDPAVIEELESVPELTLMPVSNTANSAVFIFNNAEEPGKNEDIRKAVSYALDYEQFRETFASAYAVPSTRGFIPKGTFGYTETEELTRDLEKAKEYLTKAGCEDTDNDGYVEYQGEKLTLPIMIRSDKPVHQRYAELIVNNLKEIGIEVTIDIQETAAFRELTETQRAQKSVITGLTAFGMDKNQGMAALYLWGENAMSYGQVYDEVYKELLDEAEAAVTSEEYQAAAEKIQKYYAETVPAIALFWDSHVQAYNSRFEGFQVDGTFGIMNVQTWMNLKQQA